jgi:hypothetical protein
MDKKSQLTTDELTKKLDDLRDEVIASHDEVLQSLYQLLTEIREQTHIKIIKEH